MKAKREGEPWFAQGTSGTFCRRPVPWKSCASAQGGQGTPQHCVFMRPQWGQLIVCTLAGPLLFGGWRGHYTEAEQWPVSLQAKKQVCTKKECPVISPWGLMCGWIRPQMLLQEDHIVMVWDTLIPHAVPPRCLLLFFHDSLTFWCRLQESFYPFLSCWRRVGFILPLRKGSHCSRFLAFQWKKM